MMPTDENPNKPKPGGFTKFPHVWVYLANVLSDNAFYVLAVLARYHSLRPSKETRPATVGTGKLDRRFNRC